MKQMNDLAQNTTDMTPRRGFFRRVAGRWRWGSEDSRPHQARSPRRHDPRERNGQAR
jgi:hypothetical protein